MNSSPINAVRAPTVEPGAENLRCDERLRALEQRLVRVEKLLGMAGSTPEGAARAPLVFQPVDVSVSPGLEGAIGELWLARAGVVALIVGLAFLVVFPFGGLPALVPSLIGYAAAGGCHALARAWRQSAPSTSRVLQSGALFLLYFATLRLGFFSARPVASRGTVLLLACAVLAAQYVFAFRARSEGRAVLAAMLAAATAVLGDSHHFPLALMSAIAGVAVLLYRLCRWQGLLLTTSVIVYSTHLMWLLGNPLAGHRIRGIDAPHFNLGFLLIEGATLIAAGLVRPQQEEPVLHRVARALVNGSALLLIGLLNVRLFHRGEPPWVEAALSVFFLAAATAYWIHQRARYGTGIYACFGYLALTAAIVSLFRSPDAYGWLAWQSLLVAATAVWFRSKIIIVANIFIFGAIYIANLVFAPAVGLINLSFAIVAVLTAIILGWRREDLELRTDGMRRVYLSAATIIVPYGLYHTVPRTLVSTSWLLAAGGCFLASWLLRDRAYRWMGIATLLAATAYVFVVDLSRLEPAFRILSFLVLGTALLGVSVAYARQRRKSGDSDEG